MPKLFDRPDSEIGFAVKRVNENRWFEQQQPLLLWLANTKEGRDLLCIEQNFPHIVEISKRHVKGFLGVEKDRVNFISDFRIGAKWGNIIRYRWKEFQEMAQWYYMNELASSLIKKPIFIPVAPVPRYAYLILTAYPDPDPGTNSMDAYTGEKNTYGTFAYHRNLVATSVANSNGVTSVFGIRSGGSTTQWYAFYRLFFLFDTSAIGGNTIESATFQFVVTLVQNNYADSVAFVKTAPTSNTAITTSDYSNVTLGTDQATQITFAGLDSGGVNYNSMTLNGTGLGNIDGVGISKFGLIAASDSDNVDPGPTAADVGRVFVRMADTAGITTDPKLVVVHTASFQPRSSTGGVGYFGGGGAYF